MATCFPVTGGAQYDLYAWVRGKLDADDSASSFYLRLRFYDSSGALIPYDSGHNAHSGSPESLDGVWRYSGGRVTAPPNAATAQILLLNHLNTGWVTFDDVLLTRVGQETVIKRSSYGIASQIAAIRVSGDPVSGNNGLTYFYNDHLGSNTALRKPDGSRVSTYYLPFGGYRPGSAPTQTITDRDFTGQRENMELGLLYYQARFYVPAIGRFASADTIVPDPTNPQQFNRYTYVLNNPVRFSDPTGHFTEEAITQYLQDNHDDWETVLAAWMNDAEWWATLLAASAGDVIFGSVTQSFWDGAQMLMPVYYHFAGEGQDVLSGVAYSLSAFIMENAAYGNTPFGMMTLNNIFQGNNGVTWGGLYQKDTHGHIVNVLHRMSVTSIYQHLGGAGGSSLKDNLYGELQEAFVCSFIGGGAAGGLGCAVALPFAGNLVNNWVWPNFFAGPGFAIQEGYLSHGDYIYVSAGHVFAYHGVMEQSNMQRTDYMTVSFFGTTGIYPFYQLTVDYVYR